MLSLIYILDMDTAKLSLPMSLVGISTDQVSRVDIYFVNYLFYREGSYAID